MPPAVKLSLYMYVDISKQWLFHTAHRRTSTQETALSCTTASQAVCVRNGPLRRGTFRGEDGSLLHEHQEDHRDGRGRDGVAERWATTRRGGWFVSRFLVLCPSRYFLICAFFLVGPVIKSGARWCRITGIERGRSSVQEHMKVEHWSAMQVICVKLCAFNHYILVLVFLQVKNQHLMALNKRRRLECCT